MEKKELSVYDQFKVYNAKREGDVKQKEGSRGMKLDYLSWAAAWEEVLKVDPNAVFDVVEDDSGQLYHTDGKTCDVRIKVTVKGLTRQMWLPVMDHRNMSIPLEAISSKNVNDSLMRCLVKCLATFGLGLSLYRGDDQTEFEKDEQQEAYVEALRSATCYEDILSVYQYYAQVNPRLVTLPEPSRVLQEMMKKYPPKDTKK